MNASILDYVIDGDGPELSGSDGSVDILIINQASDYYAQVRGRRFGGARKFPPSRYSTFYRSELKGIKLTLQAVNKTAATDGIGQCVNNTQAVESVNQAYFMPQQMLAPKADITLACHKLRKEAKTSTNLEWLRAHQDNNNRKETLPPEAWMNSDMDEACRSE